MTVTITAVTAPVVPQPLAYQHRARLRCAACFARLDLRPQPYGDAVIPIPAPATGRPTVARRACAACRRALPVPALFGLGLLTATVGALDACVASMTTPSQVFARHWTGDWGQISPADEGLNEDAIRDGARVFSVYHLPGGGRLWCITEADRHATTLLLPQEY